MLVSSAVTQAEVGGIDFIWILLPLIWFVLSGQRREKPQDHKSITESWYTPQDIKTTYSSIEEKATKWREEIKKRKPASVPLKTKLMDITGRRRDFDRFVEKETISPRLYQMSDSTGSIYFELTEVESGGTVVKTTYSPDIKDRMAILKVELPLKIPATPIGIHCPACGKPVLSEFILCPYCGEKLIKE